MTSDIVFTPSQVATLGQKYLAVRRNGEPGMPLGVKKIDEILNPLRGGELACIISRPGGGKTSFMMSWARRRAAALALDQRFDRVVLYVTYEQHIEDLNAFHLASETNVNITSMARGEITDEEWGRLEVAAMRRVGLPLWFVGHSAERRRKRPSLTLENLAAAFEMVENWNEDQAETFKIDSVFVDYLQRVPYRQSVESKTVGISENLDRLKDAGLAFDCPMVVGVQARREVDQRNPPIPQMDDGQWTSNIEQVGDYVFSLVRPCKYRQQGEMFGDMAVNGHEQMLISLLKQKLGKDNKAWWVTFNPAYNKLEEAEERSINLAVL